MRRLSAELQRHWQASAQFADLLVNRHSDVHVTWPTVSMPLEEPAAGCVHVWGATLEPSDSVVRTYRTLLSGEEERRAEQFHFETDRRHYVVARGTLRRILGGHLGASPSDVRFVYGPQAKPYLAPSHASTLTFNLSHSGTGLLVAVANGADVGVDLEKLRALDDADDIAKRFFSAPEVKTYTSLPDEERVAGFFNAWTRKEAFVKAVGKGLSLSLGAFDVTLRPNDPARVACIRPDDVTGADGLPMDADAWSLHAVHPANGYAAAVAVCCPNVTLECFRFSHPDAVDWA